MTRTSQQTSTQLRGVLSKRKLAMISIGGVIGAGLFVGSGTAIASAGPAILVSYIIAGLVVVLIMQMLGEMSVAHPTSGSFSDYASTFIAPWAGFSAGWLYAYQWCVTIGFESIAGAALIAQIFPAIPTWLSALVLLIVMIAVNLIRVEAFGSFEYWFAMIKVVAISLFLILGVLVLLGLFPGIHSPGLSHLVGDGGFAPKGWGAVLMGSVVVFFSFFGTEVVTIAAGEAKDPASSVRTGIRSVVWRILLFYIGSIFIVVSLMPWNSTKVMESPYAAVLGYIGIPGAEPIMRLIVLTAVMSCLNSGIYSSSRMLHAMALRRQAPRVFSRTNRFGVPVYTVFLASSIGLATIIANYFLPTTTVFQFLINSSGSVAVLVYLYITVTHFKAHRQIIEEHPETKLRMWAYPWLSLLALVVLLAVVGGMLISPSSRESLLLTLLVAAITIIAGIINQRRISSNQH